MKKSIFVVANWKEYPDTIKGAEILEKALAKNKPPKGITSVIAPPFPFLFPVGRVIKKSGHKLGCQDLSPMLMGAFTGEVSAKALASIGVKYAIIGHSERRALGEDENLIGQKLRASLFADITPILCVGEKNRESTTLSHAEVGKQLEILFKLSKKDVAKVIVAYEPVWAVGANAKFAATPEDAREMRIYIQKILADMFGEAVLKLIPILYGGSVNIKNASEYFEISGMQGLLIGRASLDAKMFVDIISSLSHK